MKRKTSQRITIEKVFRDQNRPLGIDDILQNGRQSVESLNQATVYRNLKLLMESGWLKTIKHPTRGSLYEMTEKEHHHHFHCHTCNRVFELPGCALNESDAAPEGFRVENHDVFLYGVCPACAESC